MEDWTWRESGRWRGRRRQMSRWKGWKMETRQGNEGEGLTMYQRSTIGKETSVHLASAPVFNTTKRL